jgi:hypothetical protein
MLRPIPQKLRIRHALLLHYSCKYGSITLSSRKAMRDNRYRFKKPVVYRYSGLAANIIVFG